MFSVHHLGVYTSIVCDTIRTSQGDAVAQDTSAYRVTQSQRFITGRDFHESVDCRSSSDACRDVIYIGETWDSLPRRLVVNFHLLHLLNINGTY